MAVAVLIPYQQVRRPQHYDVRAARRGNALGEASQPHSRLFVVRRGRRAHHHGALGIRLPELDAPVVVGDLRRRAIRHAFRQPGKA